MRWSIRTACLTVLLTSVVGCSDKDSVVDPGAPDTLMPLAVHNTWTYQDVPSPGPPTAGGEVITILGTKTIDGELYFTIADNGVLRNRNNGLFVAQYFDVGGFSDDLLFRFPIGDGESYTYDYISGGSVEILATRTTVTVPAGTFDCIKYTLTSVSHESYLCFAPGVGLVRTQGFDQPSESIELVSFELAE